MKAILLEDLQNLGTKGEIVEVKPGYFRNYLLPQNKALHPQSREASLILKEFKKQREQRDQQREEKKQLTEKLEGKTFIIPAKVAKEKKIFGSVDQKEILEQISRQYPDLKDTKIESEPIKELGEHEVILDLGSGLKSKVKIKVTPKVRQKSAA